MPRYCHERRVEYLAQLGLAPTGVEAGTCGFIGAEAGRASTLQYPNAKASKCSRSRRRSHDDFSKKAPTTTPRFVIVAQHRDTRAVALVSFDRPRDEVSG
jgi:hypothetical protein